MSEERRRLIFCGGEGVRRPDPTRKRNRLFLLSANRLIALFLVMVTKLNDENSRINLPINHPVLLGDPS